MHITQQLSSQMGDRTEEANRRVVSICLEEPTLLMDVSEGLANHNAALAGDCAEVFTKVAEIRPELAAPYAPKLIPLLQHPSPRARWEAMHALAMIAPITPLLIETILPQITVIIRSDKSTIARDYAIECLGNYAVSGEQAANQALPILKEAMSLWDGKHLARILRCFSRIAVATPSLRLELHMYALDYENHSRTSVSKAAKDLLKKTK